MRCQKIVASHQPHFFPWMGYFDKMAKSDLFLINDIAQLEKQSPMTRNKILDWNGKERYIKISVDQSGVSEKENREVSLYNWNGSRNAIQGVLEMAYRKSDYWDEIWPVVQGILGADYQKLIDLQMQTIITIRSLLDIKTPILFHSGLKFCGGENKSERIAQKLLSVGANVYLSGTGAKKYMDLDVFVGNGIEVVYQQFSYPEYHQINTETFVPNLSILDMLFNCGAEGSKQMFWENVKKTNEFNSDRTSRSGGRDDIGITPLKQ